MSIVRQLVQISMVEAWRGRTLAEDHVFDSRIDPLAHFLAGQPRPIIIGSVEEVDQDEDAPDAKGLLGRTSTFTVMVQTGVATGQELRSQQGTTIRGAIGETDASYEATLNLLDRQWREVLLHHDNAWSVIFRDLVLTIGKIKDVRATDPETGTKHAARFTQFKAEVMADPLPGEAIPAPIEAGLAALEADGDASYLDIATQWRALLAGDPERWPTWRTLQAGLFTTRAGMAALGQGPLTIDELVEFDEARLEVSGVAPVVVTPEAGDDP